MLTEISGLVAFLVKTNRKSYTKKRKKVKKKAKFYTLSQYTDPFWHPSWWYMRY